MKRALLLILLAMLSGCALEDFFVGDYYDDDFLDSEAVIIEGTSPGYHEFVPGSQTYQPSPPAPPPAPIQPTSNQTKEPPLGGF